MPDYELIQYSVTNRVATISLNSPKTLNAIRQKMRYELIDVVAKAERDEDVRVIILTGEGRGFCAGADLTEESDFDTFAQECAAEYEPWLLGIHNSKKLYLAAIRGAAAGIGSAMVMNCDLVMMAEDAYIYQAFSAIGLMPDGGATWQLLHKLGYQRAIDMAVNAGRLTAQECKELGLANRVVAGADLIPQAQTWAEHMAAGSPLSQAAVKTLMRKAYTMSYSEVVSEEAVMQSDLILSDDSRNAVAAFFAKENAIFTGK